MRNLRHGARASRGPGQYQLTIGQRNADTVAANMGSWRFAIIQSGILVIWTVLNVTAFIQQWAPYPFILLNLVLSFQAAYAAPFIMMSQNRQLDIDRKHAENDFQVNVKAELDIELLHQKIDQLRETEVVTDDGGQGAHCHAEQGQELIRSGGGQDPDGEDSVDRGL